MRLLLAITIAFFGIAPDVSADVCRSTGTGDWHDASIWSCGHVPQCGDTIYISGDDQVNVADDVELDEDFGCNTPTFIVIEDGGTLWFEPSERMHLACGSGVTIEDGGLLSGDAPVGAGGSNSNYIDICDNTVWSAGDGPIDGPMGYGDPLPIELLFFDAVKVNDGKSVMLVWQTASERNNDYYSIQRSKDGVEFETIATLDGAGNSVQTLDYSHVDNDPHTGWSYYRLKQTDFDGKYEIFSPVAININGGWGLQVYPNPTDGKFTLSLDAEMATDAEINIRDAAGRLVLSKEVTVNTQNTAFVFDMSEFKPGVYFVTAQDDEGMRSEHFRLVFNR